MKATLKKIVFSTFPSVGNYISAVKHRRMFRAVDNRFQRRASRKLYMNDSISVLSGPFSGVRYIDETVWGPITPKWLGSYESELHEAVEHSIQKGYTTIIDVGSAEGYYVSGFASRLPHSNVYSFDMDPLSRAQQRRLIKLNNLPNVTIGKYCSFSDFDNLISENTLLVCDIEGFEYKLLDPTQSTSLLKADVLVELHPFEHLSEDEVADAIKERFHSTHDITTIRQTNRDVTEYQQVCANRLSAEEVKTAVDERRSSSGQIWYWMTRKPLD